MTMQKSFKRLVRARMEKTGESYTAARARILAADPGQKATEGPALSVSEEVITERTGRGWEEWFTVLDSWGAHDVPQPEASDWVAREFGLDRWSSQAVTINYQRARGLRAVGEHADGFTITATKTVGVPVDRLYEAFVDESVRAGWLPEGGLRERTATRPRSARFDWGEDGSRVVVFFTPKGDGRSLASLSHERLPDGEAAERMKAFWRERVTAVKTLMEQPS
jgi:uncharacterized protein YndB with AHSA1/START domain